MCFATQLGGLGRPFELVMTSGDDKPAPEKGGDANGKPVSNGGPAGEIPPQQTFAVKGKRLSLAELCELPEAAAVILADVNAQGKRRGLKGFEQVRFFKSGAMSELSQRCGV